VAEPYIQVTWVGNFDPLCKMVYIHIFSPKLDPCIYPAEDPAQGINDHRIA